MILNDKNLNQKKTKLKLWQWIVLGIVALIFIVATVILCVFYKDAIFTENALAITLICVFALLFAVGGYISYRYFGR